MKFIGTTTKYKVTQEKLKVGISVGMIVLISAVCVVTMKTLIEASEARDKVKRDARVAALLNETTEETAEETESEEPTGTSSEASVIIPTEESVVETTLSTEAVVSEVAATDASTEASLTNTTTVVTTETTKSYTETKLVKFVYASNELNVRSGPGIEYDIVKTIEKGSGIDVVGVTDNGWYHTYNGNFVSKDLCQDEPVKVVTPTPVPLQTTAATTQATTAATQATAAPTQPQPASNGAKEGMTYYGNCKITFYGPQPLGDGTYSTSTATGSTCTEGVTCAADWSIFPAGTVIYVVNDPLGGDGYYTVEDKGSGVKGNHIDIYADAGESYSTTSCEVYIVN
ncbi:MAG: SH3 domain-containing protein [Clostridiales bacterium]|nr:SH3 domain-containing protein [Clostridiales bacterium]